MNTLEVTPALFQLDGEKYHANISCRYVRIRKAVVGTQEQAEVLGMAMCSCWRVLGYQVRVAW